MLMSLDKRKFRSIWLAVNAPMNKKNKEISKAVVVLPLMN